MELEDKYVALFGHGIPTELLPDNLTEKEIFEKMKICVQHKNDNILELFGVELSENEIY